MDTAYFASTWLPRLVCSLSRLTSLLLFGLVMFFVVGHGGLPNIPSQPTRVQLEFIALGLMMLGLALGWVREVVGGLLVLLGLAVFNVVELTVNGRLALGAFPWFAVPGVLFLLSAWLHRSRKSPTVSRNFSQPIV